MICSWYDMISITSNIHCFCMTWHDMTWHDVTWYVDITQLSTTRSFHHLVTNTQSRCALSSGWSSKVWLFLDFMCISWQVIICDIRDCVRWCITSTNPNQPPILAIQFYIQPNWGSRLKTRRWSSMGTFKFSKARFTKAYLLGCVVGDKHSYMTWFDID